MIRLKKNSKRVRVESVLQMESVECGAACLTSILAYYKKYIPLEKIRISCGVSRDGLKATNLIKAAKEYGLEAKGYAKSIDKLKEIEMPAILFWNFNHFLVLEGFSKNKVYLSDPAQGRYQVNYDEFQESYTGVVLTFKPADHFVKTNERISLFTSLKTRINNSKLAVLYVLLASFCLIIPNLIVPTFLQVFIDQYLINKVTNFVMPLLLIMVSFLFINSLLVYLQQKYLLKLETKISLVTSSNFLWHVFHLPIVFFSQRYSSEIVNRISLNDKVAKLLSNDVANTVLNVIMIFFYMILMLSYDITLTIIGVILSAINILILRLSSAARKEVNRRLVNENGKLLGTTTSGINMIETLKASGRENDFFTNWIGYLAKVVNIQQDLGWLMIRINALPPFITSLISSLCLGIGALRIMEGDMTLGSLVAFTYLINNFTKPVNQLVSTSAVFSEIQSDISRIDDVLNYDIDKQFESDLILENTKSKNKLVGYLELKNVTFGYSRTIEPLITNFNLKLKPGDRVALVGGSGSGKSTLAKIVAGLYEPWEGHILFDQKSREIIPRDILTDSLSVIDQDIHMFKGTIRENITFWNPIITEKEIVKAAKDANIHDTISKRVNAYESLMEEGGSNFSGGQRQRLEIARAIVNNPTILVMDEATSALDSESEKIIMDNLKTRGCTCLIVAHRLSTIIDCDEIIVLEKGVIVERGTHEELLAINNVYAQLIGASC